MDAWRSFKPGQWQKSIDLRDFICKNYTPYTGDDSFLQGTTLRTDSVRREVERLLVLENEKGGVLDIDTDRVSSLLTFEPG